MTRFLSIAALLTLCCPAAYAAEEITIEPTIIRGNKELPNILYVVPWKRISVAQKTEERKLMLHSLYGDLFEPVLPERTSIRKAGTRSGR